MTTALTLQKNAMPLHRKSHTTGSRKWHMGTSGNSETIGTLLPHFFVVDILPVHPKFRFLKKI